MRRIGVAPEDPLPVRGNQPRIRHANLFGPSGYVSADDSEVIRMAQEGFAQIYVVAGGVAGLESEL